MSELVPDRTTFTPLPIRRIDRVRDQIACHLANWILNHIGTKWYRTRLNALVLIGIGRLTRPKPRSARRGLDLLLERYPHALPAHIASQADDVMKLLPRPLPGAVYVSNPGPWTLADLVDEGRLLRFAIWNSTGAVYRLDEHGAVEDDPFIKIVAGS